MLRSAFNDLWPLAAALVLVAGSLAVVVRYLRPLRKWQPLAGLHGDEAGGVQSVSFVLTAPIFIMLMLLAVQITQLMIGLMTVHYAAYAAIRSASVWIPARMEPVERVGENRIGTRTLAGVYYGGTEYRIEPGTAKFEQIRTAAALACVPIAPSRPVEVLPVPDHGEDQSLQKVYAALSSSDTAGALINTRLSNKWKYANAATTIEMRVFHPDYIDVDREPPLMQYWPYRANSEFTPTEIGWRDQVRITVTHQFALLPGPGRLLARRANETRYQDQISPQIRQQNEVFYIPLSATATMVPEGEKSVIPYVQATVP